MFNLSMISSWILFLDENTMFGDILFLILAPATNPMYIPFTYASDVTSQDITLTLQLSLRYLYILSFK